MYKQILSIVLGFWVTNAHAALDFDHKYVAWGQWLTKYVVVHGPVSQVRYAEAKKMHPQELAGFLQSVGDVTRAQYDSWSREQKIAFLINAYNAYTVQLILDNYPLTSIRKLGSLFSSPWKKDKFKLFGKLVSLDFIEHETARKQFPEARMHFAFNCASVGCPQLQAKPWVAQDLNAQLEQAARAFIRDPKRNALLAEKGELQISQIFNWYKEDFVRDGGTLVKFLAARMTDDPQLQSKIAAGDFKVKYLEYDWGLNEVKK